MNSTRKKGAPAPNASAPHTGLKAAAAAQTPVVLQRRDWKREHVRQSTPQATSRTLSQIKY